MKRKFIVVLLACWFAATGVTRAQTLDQEMPELASKLSKSLTAKGFKSVAALDFTDLQGQPTELGRFLSERLSVEIVSSAGVSMVDRANIKSILAEHKLTEAGLVDPANAKKLGEFAGVDAILTGNVTALDDGIELMVKGIATSSSRIVAAERIKFAKTSEMQQLLNRGISGSSLGGNSPTVSEGGNGGTRYQSANAIATKDTGSLRVVLKSVLPMKLKDEYGRNVNGIRCSYELVNLETQRAIVVALNANGPEPNGIGKYLRSTAIDENGGIWRLLNSDVAGLSVVGVGRRDLYGPFYHPSEIVHVLSKRDELNSNVARGNNSMFGPQEYAFIYGSTTAIPPGRSLSGTVTFVQDQSQATSNPPPKVFQISNEIVIGIATTGTKRSYALHNVTFDRVTLPAKE